jgi:chemosensory pili system protein ChpA (sensor histidine kinase/response regulator)
MQPWIVVVDDNPKLRTLWVEVLEAEGYSAVGAGDGLAAMQLIHDLLPDLILLDLHMPRASGWDFLVHQERRDIGRALTIIESRWPVRSSPLPRAPPPWMICRST